METLKLMFPALALRQSKSRNRRLCVINAQKNIFMLLVEAWSVQHETLYTIRVLAVFDFYYRT